MDNLPVQAIERQGAEAVRKRKAIENKVRPHEKANLSRDLSTIHVEQKPIRNDFLKGGN